MGVKNFRKFIRFFSPESIKSIARTDLEGKTVGIDGNFWLYQIMCSMKSSNVKYFNIYNQDITHIYGFYKRINSLLQLNVKPIFVFDGVPPSLKRDTIMKRLDNKKNSYKRLKNEEFSTMREKKKLVQNSVYITKEIIKDCKILLDSLNIPYIQSVQESDSQLAFLYQNKTIEYIITDDLDIFIFGGNHILPFFKSRNKDFTVIDISTLSEKLKLSRLDLIKISILLGNDYTDTFFRGDLKDFFEYKIQNEKIFEDEKNLEIINYYQNVDKQVKHISLSRNALKNLNIYNNININRFII